MRAEDLKDAAASIRHKVYQHWDGSSESPPQSRPAETTGTSAPPLQILAWQDGRPIFPNSLVSRFDADSREHQQILQKKAELEQLFPAPAAGDPVTTPGQPGRASGACDFSVDNGLQPLDTQRDVSLVTVTEEQFTDERLSVFAVPISRWITFALKSDFFFGGFEEKIGPQSLVLRIKVTNFWDFGKGVTLSVVAFC